MAWTHRKYVAQNEARGQELHPSNLRSRIKPRKKVRVCCFCTTYINQSLQSTTSNFGVSLPEESLLQCQNLDKFSSYYCQAGLKVVTETYLREWLPAWRAEMAREVGGKTVPLGRALATQWTAKISLGFALCTQPYTLLHARPMHALAHGDLDRW